MGCCCCLIIVCDALHNQEICATACITVEFISFRECLRCNILQPRDCTIISRMEPKQVTISKPSQRTRLDDVDHRLYVATLAPIRRGHVPFV